MCDSFGVMSKRFNATCLGALYMQKFELVQSLCKFKVAPMREQVYQVRKGQFLVYCPGMSTATLKCRNGSHSELHLQKGTQQIQIPPGCQGFFQDHLAMSDFSVRLASEVLHFTWDWDTLTFLPAVEIAEMSRTLKNHSALHLHHPDWVKLQYLTQLHSTENLTNFLLGRLDLGLQELTGSVISYFPSFGTGMGLMIMVILIGLSYLNCRHVSGSGSSTQPAQGPVIIQAPAPIVMAPAAAPQALPEPYYQQQQRQLRQVKRKNHGYCVRTHSSDDDLAIRFNADQEELKFLRVQYDFEQQRPEAPVMKAPRSDSSNTPSHIKLHDHLCSLAS
jgi:hypothetical protein